MQHKQKKGAWQIVNGSLGRYPGGTTRNRKSQKSLRFRCAKLLTLSIEDLTAGSAREQRHLNWLREEQTRLFLNHAFAWVTHWHPPVSSFSSFSGGWGAKPWFSLGSLGLGLCASLAQNFFVFFSGFHLPERRNVKTDFWCTYFSCADFCADSLCADSCADLAADFRADFPRFFFSCVLVP